MLFRPLIAAAGLAAVTQAFLLPPDISATDVEIVDALPIEASIAAEHELVNIDCPGCPEVSFKKHHGSKKHHHEHSSHLELDFTIDHSLESDRLLLNGFELYPNSDPFSNILTAPQVPDKKEHHKEHHEKEHRKHKEGDNSKALKSHHKWNPHKPHFVVEQQLGFSLQSHAVAKSADEALDLVVVDLQIIEVGQTFVNGLPNVRVHLVKTPTNKLMIVKVEQTESETSSETIDKLENCPTMLCKWQAIFAKQMNKVKQGCAGMKSAMGGNHHHNMDGKTEGRHHAWGLLMKKITSHVLLPVAIGVLAGVTVSVIGMVIGTLLVGLWRKARGQTFFPTRHRRAHKTPQKEAVVEEEKSGLLAEENEELPPAYEDEQAKNASVV